jgi:hypothetical protein
VDGDGWRYSLSISLRYGDEVVKPKFDRVRSGVIILQGSVFEYFEAGS